MLTAAATREVTDDVAVLVRHDQPQFAGHEGNAAAQNAAATQRGAILLALGIAGRIDEDRALGDAALAAVVNHAVAEDGQLAQPSLQEVAAAEAGRFAVAGARTSMSK